MILSNPARLLLAFETGDGDQSLFGSPFTAQATGALWTADDGKERLSARVLNGPCLGQLVHIASRTTETLREQLDARKYISVVVYQGDDPSPVGMAAPEITRSDS